MSPNISLPYSSSPTIILTNPTADERVRTWAYTHPEWGHGLTLQGYLDREAYLLTIPLAKDGGMTHWILTDSSIPAGQRPVLSSLETLRKRALIRGKDGQVKDVWAHGIASVFTQAEFRGRGYAKKLMAVLGEYMASQQRDSEEPMFSVLFSDIGKEFYAKVGWIPFENTHLEFPVKTSSSMAETDSSVKILHDEDLPALAEVDEQLLRQELSAPSAEDPPKIRVAVLPDLDALQWHFFREGFICNTILHRKPTVRGALYTPPSSPNARVWGLWTRTYYGGLEKPEKNVLNFIRFVIEDKNISDEELLRAIRGVLHVAQNEAKEWNTAKIDMWNPSERVKRVIEEDKELESKLVVREEDSLASLQWFGEGSTGDVEWVANEKFEWC